MALSNSPHDLLSQRRLTRDRGEYVTHFPMQPCSCTGTSDKGQPRPTCRVCAGTGRVYSTGRQLKGLVASINTQDKALLQAGLAMPGDMTFSPDVAPTIPLHDYDMVQLSYSFPYEGDIIVRGTDTLRYSPAQITSVQQHNPHTGQVIIYSAAEYHIDGMRLVWQSGHGPPSGTAYSVRYEAIIDWIVYPGVTLPRIDRGTGLGQRVLLRKRHLAFGGTS